MSKKKKKAVEVVPVEKEQKKVDTLKIIQINDFHLIPPYLVEQITDREYDPKVLYALGVDIVKSPTTMLYVFADEEHKIKGFLWANLELMSKYIWVRECSLDKEYQSVGRGIIDRVLEEVLRPIKERLKLNGIRILTTHPNVYERKGFKQSKFVLMEE